MQIPNCRLTDSLYYHSMSGMFYFYTTLLADERKFDIFFGWIEKRTLYNTSVHSLVGKLLIGAMKLSGKRSRFSFDAS